MGQLTGWKAVPNDERPALRRERASSAKLRLLMNDGEPLEAVGKSHAGGSFARIAISAVAHRPIIVCKAHLGAVRQSCRGAHQH